MSSKADEIANEEVITDVSEGGARKIRVYDARGDFVIEVPDGAKITFGYFNPAVPSGDAVGGPRYGQDNVARQTALRIYKGATTGPQGNQLACFIGVKGFRDLSISLTRFTQKVTVERRFMDDGETSEWGGNQVRELVAKTEDEYL